MIISRRMGTVHRIRLFHGGLFQGGWILLITQKIYLFRIFHFHWSIIRGRICCEYIGDCFNGRLFQGG